MKKIIIELNYHEITFFGFFIVNLFNVLDGVLTYIALYIIPKEEFYETNIYALNMFNSVGFFNSFIFKICYCLFVTLCFILIINKSKTLFNKSFKLEKERLIVNNIFVIYFFVIIGLFLSLTVNGALSLIKYYF